MRHIYTHTHTPFIYRIVPSATNRSHLQTIVLSWQIISTLYPLPCNSAEITPSCTHIRTHAYYLLIQQPWMLMERESERRDRDKPYVLARHIRLTCATKHIRASLTPFLPNPMMRGWSASLMVKANASRLMEITRRVIPLIPQLSYVRSWDAASPPSKPSRD